MQARPTRTPSSRTTSCQVLELTCLLVACCKVILEFSLTLHWSKTLRFMCVYDFALQTATSLGTQVCTSHTWAWLAVVVITLYCLAISFKVFINRRRHLRFRRILEGR